MSWGMLAIITSGIRVLGQLPPLIRVLAFASPRVARQTGEPAFIWEMPYTRRMIQARMAMNQL
jgi:hypothetical protein